MWLNTKEAAKIEGVSTRTIQRRVKNGELKTKEDENGKRKSILVWIEKSDKKIDENENVATKSQKNENSSKVGDTKIKKSCRDKDGDKSCRDIEGVSPVASISKEYSFNDLDESLDWIPVSLGVSLFKMSNKTIYRKIERKEYESIVVEAPKEFGSRVTFLKVSRLSIDTQKKFRDYQTNRLMQLLPRTIAEQKIEFGKSPLDSQKRALAKRDVINSFRDASNNAKINGLKKGPAQSNWVESVNCGEILKREMKILNLDSVSIKTIQKWDKTYKDSNNSIYPVCLLDHRRQSGRKKTLSDDFIAKVQYIAVVAKPHWNSSTIYRKLKKGLESQNQEINFSAKMIERIVSKARKDKYLMYKFNNKKKLKDNFELTVRRKNQAFAMEKVESDGKRLNFLCLSPFYDSYNKKHRGIVRAEIIVWLDVASGAVLGWCMSENETVNAIRTSFCDMAENFGVPVQISLDNGSAYKNVENCPEEFAYRKNKTPKTREALARIHDGDYGFYKNMGVKTVSFVTPRNPRSKVIEAFWGYCFASLEADFQTFVGKNIQDRPEHMQLTNEQLARKEGDKIPSWEYVQERLRIHINEWNNSTRPVLTNIFEREFAPINNFKETSKLVKYSKPTLDYIYAWGKIPYPVKATVFSGKVNVNGIHYHHPAMILPQFQDKKISVIYDERNIYEIEILTDKGEILPQKGVALIPGVQIGDNFEALKQAKSLQKMANKALLAYYNSKKKNPHLESLDVLLVEQEHHQDLIKGKDDNKHMALTLKTSQKQIESDKIANQIHQAEKIDYSEIAIIEHNKIEEQLDDEIEIINNSNENIDNEDIELEELLNEVRNWNG